MINYIYIAVIVVFIVDYSGITQTLLDIASRSLGRKVTSFKPFTCSLCMTFWSCLAYALIADTLTLPKMAFICLISALSVPIGTFIVLIRECAKNGLNLILRIIDKIDDICRH